MNLFKSRNILLMVFIIALCVSTGSSWWRRRRRRRCDSSACKYKWGSCSRNCGGGIQKPIITKQKGACGKCDLPKPRKCNTKCCRVNCAFGYWGKWGRCSKICGRGTRIRRRIITRHPKCGGSKCPSTIKSRSCNTKCCRVNCRWGYWGKWGSCSKKCGKGTRKRSRKIIRYAKCGGSKCNGSFTISSSCNTKCCPVYCRWSSWNPYGKCSATCGGGKQIRIRKISRKASCGAPPCAQSGAAFFQEHSCNKNCCPIDCQWNKWKAWGRCSVTCGGGLKRRSRTVKTKAACRGYNCQGLPFEQELCNNHKCPDECAYLGCSIYSNCVTTSDGPDCVCKKGFIGDGFTCK